MEKKASKKFRYKPFVLIVVSIIILFAVGITFHYSYNQYYSSNINLNDYLNAWSQTVDYPIPVFAQMCTTMNGYIYCVGGINNSYVSVNNVYYSKVLASGNISAWKSTTRYPVSIAGENCITYNNYIYCIGGYSTQNPNSTNYTQSVYYATALSNGSLSSWKETQPFPFSAEGQSCAVNDNYIYCIGAMNNTKLVSNQVYYSRINNNGSLSIWKSTSSYPFNVSLSMCLFVNSKLYCIGGYSFSGILKPSYYTYYSAQYENGSLGNWVQAANYPFSVMGLSCFSYGSDIYCLGGSNSTNNITNNAYVYNTANSNTNTWVQTFSYNPNILFPMCLSANASSNGLAFAYCIGGGTDKNNAFFDNVYYAKLTDTGFSPNNIPASLLFLDSYLYFILVGLAIVFIFIYLLYNFKNKP